MQTVADVTPFVLDVLENCGPCGAALLSTAEVSREGSAFAGQQIIYAVLNASLGPFTVKTYRRTNILNREEATSQFAANQVVPNIPQKKERKIRGYAKILPGESGEPLLPFPPCATCMRHEAHVFTYLHVFFSRSEACSLCIGTATVTQPRATDTKPTHGRTESHHHTFTTKEAGQFICPDLKQKNLNTPKDIPFS